MAKDLYETLGVAKGASQEDIRKAYRKLAKDLHPDLNPGDAAAEERFKEVSGAFAILGDAEKRKRYDAGELDETGAETAQHRYYREYADADRPHQYSTSAGFEDFVDLGDLFEQAFTRSGARKRGGAYSTSMPFPGADVRYHLAVDFLEAAKGAKKRVTMPDGTVLDVSIPAGVEGGTVLRLKGKGRPGIDKGPAGDALVIIEARPHPLFAREGNDIHIDLPIGLHEAVLGGKVEVPTISGAVNMTVPRGASSGQTLRLRGRGIHSRRGRGDQMVHLKIVLPKKADPELESFMRSWAEAHGYDPRAEMERAP